MANVEFWCCKILKSDWFRSGQQVDDTNLIIASSHWMLTDFRLSGTTFNISLYFTDTVAIILRVVFMIILHDVETILLRNVSIVHTDTCHALSACPAPPQPTAPATLYEAFTKRCEGIPIYRGHFAEAILLTCG